MSTRNVILLSLILKTATSFASENIDISEKIPPVIVKLNKVHFSFTNGPKLTLTKEEIDRSSSINLSQALKNLIGLQTRDSLGNGSEAVISLRGFGENATSNTLILINGIPLTNPDLSPPNLNIIPLYAIEKVEIIAGSESVLYGDQAVGGTVNIITRGETKDHIESTCLAGSYNAYQCNVIFYKHKLIHFNTSLFANKTDNYRQHNRYHQQSFDLSLNQTNAWSRTEFNFNLNHEDAQYPGALTAMEVRNNRRAANNNTDFFKNTNSFIRGKNLYFFNENWRIENNAAYRPMWGKGILYANFEQKRESFYYKPVIYGRYQKLKIQTGGDLQRDRYQLNSIFGQNKNNRQVYSAFTALSYRLQSNMTVSGGIRLAAQQSNVLSFTQSDIFNRAIASTIGISRSTSQGINFYARRAESFRFPKADENASTLFGIKGLRTQRGTSYETGLSYKRSPLSADINMYLLSLRDEIAFDPLQTPQQPFGSNRNLPPTKRTGLSLSYHYLPLQSLSINGQYNYVRARFQTGLNQGKRIPLVAENIFRMGINYMLNANWQFYTEGLFTGNQFPANDDENVSGIIGAYTTYNLTLRYVRPQMNVSFHANNIFNKKYYLYTVYQSVLDAQFFYPAPERNYTLVLKVFFG